MQKLTIDFLTNMRNLFQDAITKGEFNDPEFIAYLKHWENYYRTSYLTETSIDYNLFNELGFVRNNHSNEFRLS